MVHERLVLQLEKNGGLRAEQAGFRKARSAEEQVAWLATTIRQSLEAQIRGRYGEYSKCRSQVSGRFAACLIDLVNAFPMIWIDGLLAKMVRKGFSAQVVAWIQGFLSERWAAVRWQGVVGKWMKMPGAPQGLVVIPLLFSIFIDD